MKLRDHFSILYGVTFGLLIYLIAFYVTCVHRFRAIEAKQNQQKNAIQIYYIRESYPLEMMFPTNQFKYEWSAESYSDPASTNQ